MKGLVASYVGFFLILIGSCTDVKETDEYQRVATDRDSLLEMLQVRDDQIQLFAKEFDQIERNLSAIDINKDHLKEVSSKERSASRDRIHTLIADIYIALDQNQEIIKMLETQIKDNGQREGLRAVVSTLKATVVAKERQIKELENRLSSLQIEVRNLRDAVAYKENLLAQRDTLIARKEEKILQQEKIIETKDAELHKAFYVRGTPKELEQAGIVKKAGGLMGLGSVKVLGEKLGNDRVKSLNTRTDKMILVGRYKKKRVISTHPSDSYFFIARDGQIYIKVSFPEKFWSISKYLVVEVE